MATNTEDTPARNWQSWALIREALQNKNSDALRFCAERLQNLVGECEEVDGVKPLPRGFVVAAHGHWGRGHSLAEAAKNFIKAGGKRSDVVFGTLVLGDGSPEVNFAGHVLADSVASIVNLGPVGNAGVLVRAG